MPLASCLERYERAVFGNRFGLGGCAPNHKGLTTYNVDPKVGQNAQKFVGKCMTSSLVFGATGAVGRFLLPRLIARHRVYAVSRRAQSASDNIQWLRADLNDPLADLPVADGIISLGPLDAFATWLAGNLGDAPRRVIALSSMSAESKIASVDAEERELAQRLTTAETKLRQLCSDRGIACTLFRPTLIYGTGTDRSLAPIARFARRWRCMPIPTDATGLRQPVHAADLADACLSVLNIPATFDNTYALGGAERLRFDEMLRRMGAAIPGFVAILPVPVIALHTAAKRGWLRGLKPAMLDRLRFDLVADNGPANRDFGYQPRKFVGEDTIP